MIRIAHWAFAALAALALSSLAASAFSAPLVDPAWVRQHLHDKNLVVIDVYDRNNQRTVFESGHIPGALFTAFLQDGWRSTVNGIPEVMPPIKDIEKVIGSYGIDNNSEVVLVPGGRQKADFPAVTRVYWTFKVLGHNSVSILNGGDKAWFANAANPVATGATKLKPKTFVAHFQRNLLATRADVEKVVKTHNAVLVDARIPAQFEGKKKSHVVLKAGTLPGAVNVPTEQLISADGTRLASMAKIDAVVDKAGRITCELFSDGTDRWSAGVGRLPLLPNLIGDYRITAGIGSEDMREWYPAAALDSTLLRLLHQLVFGIDFVAGKQRQKAGRWRNHGMLNFGLLTRTFSETSTKRRS